jgi:hypothetical protein
MVSIMGMSQVPERKKPASCETGLNEQWLEMGRLSRTSSVDLGSLKFNEWVYKKIGGALSHGVSVGGGGGKGQW